MLTRRTLRRYFLLRPDPEVTQLFLYAYAVLTKKYGILTHALVLMSTHEHATITDVLGNRPCFVRDLHRIVALGVKIIRKWEGPVWDGGETSVVELETPESVVDKLAYVVANPVAAGSVKKPELWPSVHTTANDMGQKVYRVERPKFFFDPKNPAWPEVAELAITIPQQLLDVYGDEARAREAVQVAVDLKVAEAHETARQKKWKFRGAAKAKLCSPYRRATSYEPLRARNPTF